MRKSYLIFLIILKILIIRKTLIADFTDNLKSWDASASKKPIIQSKPISDNGNIALFQKI